jgi:putative FmdB family regulatory protein
MPIYAYRCEACGFAKDVLQKVSDARLTVCPSCGKSSFKKQLTAAGFQLKGTGWYATDFRGGASNAAAPATTADEGTSAPAAATAASDSSGTAAAPSTPAPSGGTPSAS